MLMDKNVCQANSHEWCSFKPCWQSSSPRFSVQSRWKIEIREEIQWEGCFPCLSPGKMEMVGM